MNRRNQMNDWVPAERAIYDAIQAVEAMPGHVLLTDAVIALGQAKNKVSEYVEAAQNKVRAAAPDLLASCQEFLPILERQLVSLGREAEPSEAYRVASERLARMRAAITKATA